MTIMLGFDLLTTPSKRMILLWLNCPSIDASSKKLSLSRLLNPFLSFLTATNLFFGVKMAKNISPNSPVSKTYLE